MSTDGRIPVKLETLCSRITVGHVGSMANEYVDDGVPFLRSQNVLPFRLSLDDVKFITPAFHSKLKKCALRPGDVVVVRTGYPGTAAVVPESLPESNCADLVVISPRTDLLDPYFLVAVFNSTWGRATVSGNLVGAAQQHFNIGSARSLEIALPGLREQKRIAGILSAYDDLIENCERRIRVLDEMARSLYREWFVDCATTPALRMAVPLREVADVNAVKVDTRNPPATIGYIDIASVGPGRIDTISPFAFGDAPGRARRVVRHGDTLWSCVRPNRRSHALVVQPEADTVASTGFAVLSPRKVPASYLYLATTTDEFVGYLEKRATGAAYPAVTGKDFEEAVLKLPADDLLAKFGQLADTWFAAAAGSVRRTV